MQITRVDPLEVDLDLADRLAAVDRASLEGAGLEVRPPTGPSRLTALQHGNNGRPLDALWVAGDGADVVGWAIVELPWRDNLDLSQVRGHVHPAHRRRGLGRRLVEKALAFAAEQGRTAVYSGAFLGTDGPGFLEAQGFTSEGQHVYAVRRLDLHAGHGWDRLHDEAAAAATDYELVHVVGATPDELLDGMVTLHEAINDAPADEGTEPDVWDADRVRAYDEAMAHRRQTTYRVLARHVPTGEWAGMSLLCVDEFSPGVAFQEDTNVVRAHRGHRLGLLMKVDMLRWISQVRPEVSATDTWNATDNHHMIAVNERLGCRVIARHAGYRHAVPPVSPTAVSGNGRA
jgi:GNAT superfamily N-acetyltransferase